VPEGYEQWKDDLAATADEGVAALKAAWDKSPAAFRSYLTTTNQNGWEALKKRAALVKDAVPA
jgi:hypothetical protein